MKQAGYLYQRVPCLRFDHTRSHRPSYKKRVFVFFLVQSCTQGRDLSKLLGVQRIPCVLGQTGRTA